MVSILTPAQLLQPKKNRNHKTVDDVLNKTTVEILSCATFRDVYETSFQCKG